jgi:hypothetical protein
MPTYDRGFTLNLIEFLTQETKGGRWDYAMAMTIERQAKDIPLRGDDVTRWVASMDKGGDADQVTHGQILSEIESILFREISKFEE